MATTAKRVKDAKKPKFSSRKHNRCQICGRPRAFLRKFGLCRLCFRGLALRGRDSWGFEVVLVEESIPRGVRRRPDGRCKHDRASSRNDARRRFSRSNAEQTGDLRRSKR